jgi:hypothetical protein
MSKLKELEAAFIVAEAERTLCESKEKKDYEAYTFIFDQWKKISDESCAAFRKVGDIEEKLDAEKSKLKEGSNHE